MSPEFAENLNTLVAAPLRRNADRNRDEIVRRVTERIRVIEQNPNWKEGDGFNTTEAFELGILFNDSVRAYLSRLRASNDIFDRSDVGELGNIFFRNNQTFTYENFLSMLQDNRYGNLTLPPRPRDVAVLSGDVTDRDEAFSATILQAERASDRQLQIEASDFNDLGDYSSTNPETENSHTARARKRNQRLNEPLIPIGRIKLRRGMRASIFKGADGDLHIVIHRHDFDETVGASVIRIPAADLNRVMGRVNLTDRITLSETSTGDDKRKFLELLVRNSNFLNGQGFTAENFKRVFGVAGVFIGGPKDTVDAAANNLTTPREAEAFRRFLHGVWTTLGRHEYVWRGLIDAGKTIFASPSGVRATLQALSAVTTPNTAVSVIMTVKEAKTARDAALTTARGLLNSGGAATETAATAAQNIRNAQAALRSARLGGRTVGQVAGRAILGGGLFSLAFIGADYGITAATGGNMNSAHCRTLFSGLATAGFVIGSCVGSPVLGVVLGIGINVIGNLVSETRVGRAIGGFCRRLFTWSW